MEPLYTCAQSHTPPQSFARAQSYTTIVPLYNSRRVASNHHHSHLLGHGHTPPQSHYTVARRAASNHHHYTLARTKGG
jgi:hypothetical protein